MMLELEGVIVTAMGIKRNQKFTYAVKDKSEDLTKTRAVNVATALSGKEVSELTTSNVVN
jgi:hypothetical protein